MKEFSGIDYIRIAIANAYGHGLDKTIWKNRIDWVHSNRKVLFSLMDTAEEPHLYIKAVHALYDAEKGIGTGYIMGMDATQSGLQILACLIGCKVTARNVNLIDTGKVEDFYGKMANTMSQITGRDITRAEIKYPVMTVFYGSKAMPQELFPDPDDLEAFYKALEKECPGAMEVIDDIQSCWRSDVSVNSWTLPDGHRAVVKITEVEGKKIEVDELDHATFTHYMKITKPMESGLSLLANIVQGIDGYIVREMDRMAYKQKFDLLTIHDSFWTSPNHMNNVRRNYRTIMTDIAKSNLLESILNEITGTSGKITKISNDLTWLIPHSEYAIC